jgi:hypothetical protein
VPQACLPDADRLVSKNIALPARAASDSPDPVDVVVAEEVVDAVVVEALVVDVVTGVSDPPHPDNPTASSQRHGQAAIA